MRRFEHFGGLNQRVCGLIVASALVLIVRIDDSCASGWSAAIFTESAAATAGNRREASARGKERLRQPGKKSGRTTICRRIPSR